MAKEKQNLTIDIVKSASYAPEGPKVQYLWDAKVAGFGVRLYPSGKKSYVIGYRPAGEYRMRFAVISRIKDDSPSPETARRKAKKILANEEDPIQKKRDAKAEATKKRLVEKRHPIIDTLIDSYYSYEENRQRSAEKAGKGKHISKASLQQYRWTIEKYIRPYWGSWIVGDVKRRDIKAFLRDLVDRQEYSGSVVNNILQRFKGLMRFALDEELIELNPCNDLTTDYESIPVDRTLNEKEIRAFWFGLSSTDIHQPVQLALKLLLVTAQRRSEIVAAQWEWVDWDDKTLTIPRQNVKNRKGANVVPLSSLAIGLLKELKKCTAGSPFLVPALQNPNTPMPPETVTSQLRKNIAKLGVDPSNSFTPHDLRRTVATMLSGEEVQREHIKAVLNHAFGDVTEIYINSQYINQKRRYLDLWANKLQGILDDKPKGSNVVAIDKR